MTTRRGFFGLVGAVIGAGLVRGGQPKPDRTKAHDLAIKHGWLTPNEIRDVRDYCEFKNTYFVGNNGVDGDGYGLTPDRPFRSLGYAVKQGSGARTFNMKPGFHDISSEVSIPSNTAIIGWAPCRK